MIPGAIPWPADPSAATAKAKSSAEGVEAEKLQTKNIEHSFWAI